MPQGLELAFKANGSDDNDALSSSPVHSMNECNLQALLDDPDALSDMSSLLSNPADAISPSLPKIVLARRTAAALAGGTHGLQLLRLLQQRSPGSYQVALVLPCGATFVSATPERLFKRHGASVLSEAVAGAYPSGPSVPQGLIESVSSGRVSCP